MPNLFKTTLLHSTPQDLQTLGQRQGDQKFLEKRPNFKSSQNIFRAKHVKTSPINPL
jgi:hypothetical protein